jgi:hypothetical protein
MTIDEVEIYVTPNGLSRAAIVRRTDGLFCVYVHMKWSAEELNAFGIDSQGQQSWLNDSTPLSLLYENMEPELGIYGTLEDAQRQVRSLRGFEDALPLSHQ